MYFMLQKHKQYSKQIREKFKLLKHGAEKEY